MAKELEEFPAKHGNAKYDWAAWLNGKPWELTQGEDFDISLSSFRVSAVQAARDRGGKIRSTKTSEKTLAIMFYVPEQ